MLRRAKWAGLFLAALLVVSVISVTIASQNSMSASEAAANATPPPAGPTTAEVEERALAETLSVRGIITATTAVSVSAPLADSDGTRSVMTGAPVEPGAVLTLPAVVVEVAGRPIITVHSPATFYRDLTFGDQGRDVSQLQLTLGVRDTGTFDVATQNALDSLYENLGYSAPMNNSDEAESEQQDTVQPLLDALEDARANGDAAVKAAELSLSGATADLNSGSGSAAAVQQAELELGNARAARAREVSRAERNLATERERLQRQERITGTRFESDEVIGVPFASTTVIGVSAELGDELEPGAEIATLGDPTLRAITYVSLAEAQMLQPEMAVDLTGSTLPASLTGSVVSVASEPSSIDSAAADAGASIGSTPSQERPYRVEVTLGEQPPSTAVATGVLLTVTVQGTGSTVVAVPVVALQRINGQDVVVTVPDDKRWEVEPGFTAEGWVELRSGAPPVGSLVETR